MQPQQAPDNFSFNQPIANNQNFTEGTINRQPVPQTYTQSSNVNNPTALPTRQAQKKQAMAEMGMAQDAQEYKKQQDAVERDLQLLQYYTNIDQANAKEARGYQFQTQQDLKNLKMTLM